mmetsp:Transcript_393/g.376  ORF Transcript_393/g.376 Transcript_393/m.376 type:complete len:148 (+) Transcript_393:1-444(+)
MLSSTWLFVSLATTILIISTTLQLAESKICVATAENKYLCTDDAVKANAYRMADPNYEFDMSDMGVEQTVSGTKAETEKVRKVIEDMKEYYLTEVMAKPEYDSVRTNCVNKNPLCAFWASIGECDTNRGFMLTSCAPTCRSCLQLRN